MRALKQFARERGLLYHTHLAEGKAETERIRAWTGRGEAEELAHLGVLDESTILAHSIWLTQEEITLLAQSHAVVAHCPSTNTVGRCAAHCGAAGIRRARRLRLRRRGLQRKP